MNEVDGVAPNGVVPISGRLIGCDYGTARIGLAVCDPSQSWVTPLGTYARRSPALDREYFSRLVRDEDAVGCVVGLPIHCDGRESQKSREVRQFVEWLADCTGVPVALHDERFSTAEARRLLAERPSLSSKKKKSKLDGLAAHLILSSFLESSREPGNDSTALED